MFAAPLEIEEEQITYVADNGHAMAPYMMSVGLWVGCIAFCLMYPLTSCPGKMDSGLKWWFSKASVLVVTAVLQAVVMLAALAVFDGFDPERAGLTALTACAASVAFMSVMYFFTSLLGRVGSFLMLVFMVFSSQDLQERILWRYQERLYRICTAGCHLPILWRPSEARSAAVKTSEDAFCFFWC